MKYRSLRFLITICVLLINLVSALLTFGMILLLSRLQPLAFLALPQASILSCIIIGSLISVFVYRRILRPIDELIRLTEKIKDGDYSVRADETRGVGSIGVLVKRFNQMAERLGSVEMLKSDFIGTFSHEFKTPMVSIRGFAKQLKHGDLTEAERNEYTDIIIAESERLTAMSQNVLLLSRFENQKIIENCEDFSLDEQLRHCILLLERAWEGKHIDWDLSLDEITLTSNASVIEHIWINLFSNAIKFSPPGGVITVSAKEANGTLTVTVRDSGCGMTQKTAEHIFDKFYQADSSRATEGNGLGLSIVKRIVELADGEIALTSEPGRGTTFRVSLPNARQASSKSA